MIKLGTKLKSIRSGEIVEVIAVESGQKKVRKQDGTEKYLSDCNIARWYDEVTEQEKAVKTAPVKAENQDKPTNTSIKEKRVKKANSEEVLMGKKLGKQFLDKMEENKWVAKKNKLYNGILAKEKTIGHFHLMRKKLKFEFKPSDLGPSDIKWLLKYPQHYRLAYCHYFEVTDEAGLDKVVELLERISKQEKK